MTLRQQQALFAQQLARLIDHIYANGYTCSLGEAYRTPEQARLNAQKGIGIARSLHTDRLAIDINLFDSTGKFITDTKGHEWLGIYWESLDTQNRWGGRFSRPDGNHYERRRL